MTGRRSTLVLAILIGLATCSQALAQANPMDPMWRREPVCLFDFQVPSVMMSRGYRNAQVVDTIDTEHVRVVAENSTGRYQFVFDLCRGEIDERERL